MTGVRAYESVQRLQYLRNVKRPTKVYPIRDWHDSDVWLYLHTNRIKIPDAYLYMYQIGRPKKQLRISQFFSSDTVHVLWALNQYYPDLMERVIRREPNAYLVSLYWDSEMFRRRTRTRRELEAQRSKDIDYKAKLAALLADIDGNFKTENQRRIARQYRARLVEFGPIMNRNEAKQLYEGLIAGDPKGRTLRAVATSILSRYAKIASPEGGS